MVGLRQPGNGRKIAVPDLLCKGLPNQSVPGSGTWRCSPPRTLGLALPPTCRSEKGSSRNRAKSRVICSSGDCGESGSHRSWGGQSGGGLSNQDRDVMSFNSPTGKHHSHGCTGGVSRPSRGSLGLRFLRSSLYTVPRIRIEASLLQSCAPSSTNSRGGVLYPGALSHQSPAAELKLGLFLALSISRTGPFSTTTHPVQNIPHGYKFDTYNDSSRWHRQLLPPRSHSPRGPTS